MTHDGARWETDRRQAETELHQLHITSPQFQVFLISQQDVRAQLPQVVRMRFAGIKWWKHESTTPMTLFVQIVKKI